MKATTAALLTLALQAIVSLASAQPVEGDPNWLKQSSTYRAIFCGESGYEEASKPYSEAMNAALRAEHARGKTTDQSIRAWRREHCDVRSTAVAASAASKVGGSK